MLEKYWWRTLQVLTPIMVFAWLWVNIPAPKFEHTQNWTDARARQAAYQYDASTEAGRSASIELIASAEKLVSDESAKISAISDPLQRLTAMSNAEVQLTRMISKHPMWPGVIAPGLQDGLRQAAGICGGPSSDPEMIRVAQTNTQLLGAAYDEEQRIMKQHGFGATEPASLTAPYYFGWVVRWILLLTLPGLVGALVLGFKLAHFGYDWQKVAEREYGSIAIACLVAPFANMLLVDAYEEREIYSNCLVGQEVRIGDALRLSFSFRAAIVATIVGVLTYFFGGARIALAADNTPVVVQTTTYLDLEDKNAKADNEIRFVIPMDNGNAVQLDYNLNSDMFDFGIRGRTRTFSGSTQIQPRLLAVFNKDGFAVKLQTLTLGKGWCLFSSLKLPEKRRASLYNELAIDTGQLGQAQIQAALIECNNFGQSADWQAGPLVNLPLGKGTLSVLTAFGLGGGGPGDQLRVQYTLSF